MSQKILVVGASGHVGQLVVEALSGRGAQVVATSRNPEKQAALAGVSWVSLNLSDPATFGPALQGVDKVFMLSPGGYAESDTLMRPLIGAIGAQPGVEHVVVMSAMGVEASEEIALRRFELAVEATGKAFTHLRPGWFMQNFETFWLPVIQATGKILLPAGDATVSFIDARDIADVAVEVLLDPTPHAGKAYTLTGPQALTHAQVAGLLTEVSGRVIGYEDISEGAFSAMLTEAGLPSDYRELMLALFQTVRAGWASAISPDVPTILKRPARGFAAYAREAAAAWRA
jgi:uncharacterized protein YbjT (DUF2867 family)